MYYDLRNEMVPNPGKLEEWFKQEHPDSYEIKDWIKGIDGKLVGWFNDYVPTIRTKAEADLVVEMLPKSFYGESGIQIHVICPDAELFVMAEDWLDSCIGWDFYEESQKEGFDDPYEWEGTIAYCVERMKRFRNDTNRTLRPDGWHLVLEQLFENRASRMAWMRPRLERL